MIEMMLFSDGSVNTQTKTGYGAYLAVSDYGLSIDSLKKNVKLKQFENTSSTKLELETLLWALEDIQTFKGSIVVYTDSQNIVGLHQRREKLEQCKYLSNKNKFLNNYKLYQKFFIFSDKLNLKLVKVHGHLVAGQKKHIDFMFTLVDRASRRALRYDNHNSFQL